MKLGLVFLRNSCILPDHFDPLRGPFGHNWAYVEEIATPVFDTMIRHAGWHFIYIKGACCRRGFGITREVATYRAITRALKGVTRQCNAAELDFAQVVSVPGFHIANVTVRPRLIQQHSSPKVADKRHFQAVPR